MDDITKISAKKSKDNTKIKYFKFLLTRIFLSIILVLSICIAIKLNSNNKNKIYQFVFKDSLKFTKINKYYQKTLGKIVPSIPNNNNLVFNSNDLKSYKYKKYLNGVKINVPKSSVISSLQGGIVVFNGNDDNYGNTIIIQGNDDKNYWYGNIINTTINLYDYIEKDTIIGESKDDYIYLVIQKDNKYLNYEDIL